MRLLQPPGWPPPSGYSNGIAASGEMVFVGGQIGWNAAGEFAEGIAAQVEQALRNVAEVLAAAGGSPADIVRLTWFLCDMDEYTANLPAIGRAYRTVMGKHFPAMSAVAVVRLVEPLARVEIEATAVLPAKDGG